MHYVIFIQLVIVLIISFLVSNTYRNQETFLFHSTIFDNKTKIARECVSILSIFSPIMRNVHTLMWHMFISTMGLYYSPFSIVHATVIYNPSLFTIIGRGFVEYLTVVALMNICLHVTPLILKLATLI